MTFGCKSSSVRVTERVPVNVPLKPEYTSRGHGPEPQAASPLEISSVDPTAAPPLKVKVEDYVVFFERTVQTLTCLRARLVARVIFVLPVSVSLAGLAREKRGQSHVPQPVWLPAYRFSFLPIYFAILCLVACVAN